MRLVSNGDIVMNRLRVYIDKFLYDYFWRLPLPGDLRFKYSFPTKRMVRYCFQKFSKDHIEYKYEQVAHMYAYDCTVDKDNLSLIYTVYEIHTRERVRQILAKFIRQWYR